MTHAPKSILVIDDDRAIIRLLARVFESEGYAVKTALTGATARAIVANARYDLAIVDVRLPDVNGIDLIQTIKKSSPGLKLVMLTGFPSEEIKRKAFENGADDYLSKPVGPEELLKLVDSLLKADNR